MNESHVKVRPGHLLYSSLVDQIRASQHKNELWSASVLNLKSRNHIMDYSHLFSYLEERKVWLTKMIAQLPRASISEQAENELVELTLQELNTVFRLKREYGCWIAFKFASRLVNRTDARRKILIDGSLPNVCIYKIYSTLVEFIKTASAEFRQGHDAASRFPVNNILQQLLNIIALVGCLNIDPTVFSQLRKSSNSCLVICENVFVADLLCAWLTELARTLQTDFSCVAPKFVAEASACNRELDVIGGVVDGFDYSPYSAIVNVGDRINFAHYALIRASCEQNMELLLCPNSYELAEKELEACNTLYCGVVGPKPVVHCTTPTIPQETPQPLTNFPPRRQKNAIEQAPRAELEELPTSVKVPVGPAASLSSPYQITLRGDFPCYFYKWQPPDLDLLSDLCDVPKFNLDHTSQMLLFVFAKPICEDPKVCRFPLYFSGGMHRFFVEYVGCSSLSRPQVDTIIQAHQLLARMSAHNNGLRIFLRESRAKAETAFANLCFRPEASRINGCLTLFDSKLGRVDFDALEGLLRWEASELDDFTAAEAGGFADPVKVMSNVICQRNARLSQLPQEQWPGRVVNALHLPRGESILLQVDGPAGARDDQLAPTAATPIKHDRTIYKTNQVVSVGSTYHQFYMAFFPKLNNYLAMPDVAFQKNCDKPLAQVVQLSLPENLTTVTNGSEGCEMRKFSGQFISYTLSLHPLSAFVVFQLSLVPYILHQLERCLKSCELSETLREQVYGTPARVPPPGGVCMPDRLYGPLKRDTDAVKDANGEIVARAPDPNMEVCDCKEVGYTPVDKATNDRLLQLDPAYQTGPLRRFVLGQEGRSSAQDVPTGSEFIPAMTLLEAADMTNFERLEWLGDSVLNFSATCLVIAEARLTDDLSKLTQRVVALVRNLNLYQIAQKLALPKKLLIRPFTVAECYLPPGYCAESMMAAFESSDYRFYMKLCGKRAADAVEALAGCFMFHCGPDAAVDFLRSLGLGRPEDSLETVRFFSDHFGPAIWLDEDESLQARELPAIARVQTALAYEFQNIEHLMRALIDPTAQVLAATWGNYLRYAFLGTSLLEMLFSQKFFSEYVAFGPGDLTDVRSGLINKFFLATLLIKRGLHKSIMHDNVDIATTIREVKVGTAYDPKKHPSFKVLGNFMLSLVSAVYIDCGYDLHQTWEVFKPVFMEDMSEVLNLKKPNHSRHILARLLDTILKKVDPVDRLKLENPGVQILSLPMQRRMEVCAATDKGVFSIFAKNERSGTLALAKRINEMNSVNC